MGGHRASLGRRWRDDDYHWACGAAHADEEEEAQRHACKRLSAQIVTRRGAGVPREAPGGNARCARQSGAHACAPLAARTPLARERSASIAEEEEISIALGD